VPAAMRQQQAGVGRVGLLDQPEPRGLEERSHLPAAGSIDMGRVLGVGQAVDPSAGAVVDGGEVDNAQPARKEHRGDVVHRCLGILQVLHDVDRQGHTEPPPEREAPLDVSSDDRQTPKAGGGLVGGMAGELHPERLEALAEPVEQVAVSAADVQEGAALRRVPLHEADHALVAGAVEAGLPPAAHLSVVPLVVLGHGASLSPAPSGALNPGRGRPRPPRTGP
jgi:hypothetical protein